ncbi:MAG: pyridoxamine 5'-phosphate oxidase family protein [Gammaproteobacteria bacterium]|nr:pyridoxamine 5'-phosphate oxidase family protein [Gammaproteobacteria bacterium]
MQKPTSDIAFTPAVKAQQERLGSREAYSRMEQRGGWLDRVTPELAAFIAERDSLYLATASAEGQPYLQHRGGPKGFLRVLDEKTLGFVDYRGNKQYITTGNLSENDRAFLFLMDYEHRQRIKFWGKAKVIDDDAALQSRLLPTDYKAKPERVIVFRIEAWDANCPQHIPQLVPATKVARIVEDYEARIAELERALARSGSDEG